MLLGEFSIMNNVTHVVKKTIRNMKSSLHPDHASDLRGGGLGCRTKDVSVGGAAFRPSGPGTDRNGEATVEGGRRIGKTSVTYRRSIHPAILTCHVCHESS